MAKKSHDRVAMLWWAITPLSFVGTLYYVPTVEWVSLPTEAYLCLVATAFIHAGYFYYLSRAYAVSDLSFVYPYSRGLATVLTTLMGVFILGEVPSIIGWCGIILAVVTVLAEPFVTRGHVHHLTSKARRLVIITGVFIGLYLITDKVGVHYFSPLAYLCFMLFGSGVLMAPPLLMAGRLLPELRKSSQRIFAGAFFLFTSYGLILTGMVMAPIAYVAAVRSIGIVVSGLAGVILLNEKVSRTRWAIIGLITFSIVLIKLA